MQRKFAKIMKGLYVLEKFYVLYKFSYFSLSFWIYTKVIWSKERLHFITTLIASLSKCFSPTEWPISYSEFKTEI